MKAGSDLQSPSSVRRLQDGESGSRDGDFTTLTRNLQQRQRGGAGGSGSPAHSVGPEGSTSSQTRGLKRLTRKLSFRQRQAQANLQASRLLFVAKNMMHCIARLHREFCPCLFPLSLSDLTCGVGIKVVAEG